MITSICKESNAGLIVDLSHLYIDAKNNKFDPLILLGKIPWQYLVEIHLSGIIEAKDGVYHDGHSEPVNKEIWNLLMICLEQLVPCDKNLVLTIEHTVPSWGAKNETYLEDFAYLKTLVENINHVSHSQSEYAPIYARNYLKKLLYQWLPELEYALLYDEL